MKIVILAAGLGSRLDSSEEHIPKALTTLGQDKSILHYQLEAFASYFSLDDIFIVVGYRKEVMMDAFPELIYIYNPLFAQENTAKSLERALKKIDDDVLWINGDVAFRPALLEKIIQANRTAIVVNKAPVQEEEIKYRLNDRGQIQELSKQVLTPEGEAVGICFFKKADLPLLKKNLAECQSTDYFEKAIELGIQQGQIVWPLFIHAEDCIEIDFPADLLHAKELLKQWKTSH